MKFTDDDLKRLKEAEWLTHREKIMALLARMEAAEKLNDSYRDLIDCVQKGLTNGKGFKEHWDAEEAWRKAAGKYE